MSSAAKYEKPRVLYREKIESRAASCYPPTGKSTIVPPEQCQLLVS